MKKPPPLVDGEMRLYQGDQITGIIFSKDDQTAIGHTIALDCELHESVKPGLIFDDGVKEYVIVDIDCLDLSEVSSMIGCIPTIEKLEKLNQHGFITLDEQLYFIEVMDANFGYL